MNKPVNCTIKEKRACNRVVREGFSTNISNLSGNEKIQLLGLLNQEIRRYFRVPLQTIFTPIVSTTIYLLIFGLNLGQTIFLSQKNSYLAFLIPGLISLELMRTPFENSTSAIMIQKLGNELQDLRIAPLTTMQIYLGKAIASLTRGMFVALSVFVIGEIFYLIDQKTLLGIANPALLTFFGFFAAMTFASLGIFVGMWAKSFEHINGIGMLILLPLIYLGGVFFELEKIAPFWQRLPTFNPLFHIINGIRYAILGNIHINLKETLLVTLLFFLLCFVLAMISLKKENYYLI